MAKMRFSHAWDSSWQMIAYYDPKVGDLAIDQNELRRKMAQLPRASVRDAKSLVQELLQTDIPRFEKDLQEWRAELQSWPDTPLTPRSPETPQMLAGDVVISGERKYAEIKAPVLAIFAVPPSYARYNDTPGMKAEVAEDLAKVDAVKAGIPGARVVCLPYDDHFVFRSNEVDVLREINAFMAGLQ